jgi:N-acetylglucosamine kinase-like BadF-type ATPase
MRYVLGVDGGNTKTVALVADEGGAVLGTGRSGCGDIYGTATESAAVASIRDAVEQALEKSRLRPAQIDFAAHCLAGADWPEDHEYLERELSDLSRGLSVFNDGFAALRAGSADGTGVAIVCGTYAAIVARAPDGSAWSSAFWQEPLGALAIAWEGLHATFRAELGIDPPTRLRRGILEFFGKGSVAEVVHLLTARGTRGRHAGLGYLARVVLDAAQASDPAAVHVAERHGRMLGVYGAATARRVGLLLAEPLEVVLSGGVLRHGSTTITEALEAHLLRLAPRARFRYPTREPVAGALLFAIERLCGEVPHGFLRELDATMPPPSFFAT